MGEQVHVDTGVGRLAVTTSGEGPPAVLWNSLFVDERSWQRVVGPLARDRRLVVVTGPGHGSSTDPGRRYTQLDCVRAAAEVLDALAVGDPVDWVGNAWGGHVGLRFAVAYPERTRTLVTIGTPVQPLTTAEAARTRLLLRLHRLVGPARVVADPLVETLLAPATRDGDPEAVGIVRSCFAEADRRSLRNAVVSISLHRENLTPLLPRVAAPTLMVTGQQHSGWTPAQADAAVALLPDGKVAVVPDAAYLVPLEQPAAVVDLVRDHWTSARAPRVT